VGRVHGGGAVSVGVVSITVWEAMGRLSCEAVRGRGEFENHAGKGWGDATEGGVAWGILWLG
jgi:hypothetical protein